MSRGVESKFKLSALENGSLLKYFCQNLIGTYAYLGLDY